MGAWGAGIWDNDYALDAKARFMEAVGFVGIKGQETKMIEILLEDPENIPQEILALVDMYIDYGGKVKGRVRELFGMAMKHELTGLSINSWRTEGLREERIKVLRELGRRADGKTKN